MENNLEIKPGRRSIYPKLCDNGCGSTLKNKYPKRNHKKFCTIKITHLLKSKEMNELENEIKSIEFLNTLLCADSIQKFDEFPCKKTKIEYPQCDSFDNTGITHCFNNPSAWDFNEFLACDNSPFDVSNFNPISMEGK